MLHSDTDYGDGEIIDIDWMIPQITSHESLVLEQSLLNWGSD